MKNLNLIPKARGGEHKAIVVSIRNETPGGLLWLLENHAEYPILKGLGLNTELENQAISNIYSLIQADAQLRFHPDSTESLSFQASINVQDFPTIVAGTMLNAFPGRTEIISLSPSWAASAIEIEQWEDGIILDEDAL